MTEQLQKSVEDIFVFDFIVLSCLSYSFYNLFNLNNNFFFLIIGIIIRNGLKSLLLKILSFFVDIIEIKSLQKNFQQKVIKYNIILYNGVQA